MQARKAAELEAQAAKNFEANKLKWEKERADVAKDLEMQIASEEAEIASLEKELQVRLLLTSIFLSGTRHRLQP